MRQTFAVLLLVLCLPAAAASVPTVTVLPAVPLIETTDQGRVLNFDFLLKNPGDAKLEITTIEMSMFTAAGTFIGQRRVQPNGMSILTIPNRLLEPSGELVVFNPFHTIPDQFKFAKLRYEFVFGDTKENDELYRVQVEVRPAEFKPKTAMRIPISGHVFVHDGHDFLAHHRRLDITGDMTRALKLTSNMTRYAYDFVNIDAAGEMRKHKSEEPSDYYCFGQPVYAPADGVVLEAADGLPDNSPEYRWKPDFEAVIKNIHTIGGNYLFLDHGNGEYSFLAHLKNGSLTVKAGDRVKRGQHVGNVGNSGDSLFPHLHFQLQSDAGAGEGLPSYFENFERVTSDKPVFVKRGQVDTGDVLIVK